MTRPTRLRGLAGQTPGTGLMHTPSFLQVSCRKARLGVCIPALPCLPDTIAVAWPYTQHFPTPGYVVATKPFPKSLWWPVG